jgi:hypothetical protein
MSKQSVSIDLQDRRVLDVIQELIEILQQDIEAIIEVEVDYSFCYYESDMPTTKVTVRYDDATNN